MKSSMLFVVAMTCFFVIVTTTACGSEQSFSQERIEFAAGVAFLPEPGQVPQDQLPGKISEAEKLIRSRLPQGRVGDNQFDQLMKAVNRVHNRMLQPEISGKLQTSGMAALRGVYAILWKLATREFFFIIVPVDDCMMMFKLQLESPACSPQLVN